jgi:hypothetical protein
MQSRGRARCAEGAGGCAGRTSWRSSGSSVWYRARSNCAGRTAACSGASRAAPGLPHACRLVDRRMHSTAHSCCLHAAPQQRLSCSMIRAHACDRARRQAPQQGACAGLARGAAGAGAARLVQRLQAPEADLHEGAAGEALQAQLPAAGRAPHLLAVRASARLRARPTRSGQARCEQAGRVQQQARPRATGAVPPWRWGRRAAAAPLARPPQPTAVRRCPVGSAWCPDVCASQHRTDSRQLLHQRGLVVQAPPQRPSQLSSALVQVSARPCVCQACCRCGTRLEAIVHHAALVEAEQDGLLKVVHPGLATASG